MPRDTLHILCPAKINLALSVGAARPEDGLHPICSWMVAIDLCDDLTLSRAENRESSFDLRWCDTAPLPQTVDWPIESDLTYRAHALMETHVGRSLPVDVMLRKNIPSGAGLGGGSGDAAGMLVGLNTLFELGLDDGSLTGIALKLGADVMFMLMVQTGACSAVVSGIGERPEVMESGREMVFVLVLPHESCATAAVYGAFDRIAVEPRVDRARVMRLHGDTQVKNTGPFNDLTEAAFTVQPTLRALRDRVQAAAGTPVHLSGSGSAMFAVAENPEQSETLAQKITEQTGAVALSVRTRPG